MVIASSQTHFNPAATTAAEGRLDDLQPFYFAPFLATRLILADEPTAALDPAAADEVCQLLTGAAARATLITVVHNPALLPQLAERVIGLKNGRIVFDLPTATVDEAKLANLYALPNPVPNQLGEAPSTQPLVPEEEYCR